MARRLGGKDDYDKVGNQFNPQIVSDGSGGAIMVWLDLRNGTTYDIYAQRLNSAGAIQWTLDGIALCTTANDQNYVRAVPDNAGCAIITWRDLRGGMGDIYAQRLSGAGMAQWTADGVGLCTEAADQDAPEIAADGFGGAVALWMDGRAGTSADVYAQGISAGGLQ